MKHAATGIEPQDDAAGLLHAVLDAIRSECTEDFDAIVRRHGISPLIELAASEYGVELARVPHQVLPDDHRISILHSAARMYRYTGDNAYLDGALFQALVTSLQAGDADWAEPAARCWYQLVLHTGETSTIWPQARSLLTRFPEQVEARPGLLGPIATIAATCGVPEAGELWEQVLAHPALGDRVERRWELELDWARCWLMLGGGELSRAITVLHRVRRGFGETSSASAQLSWTTATVELVAGLAWAGRTREALDVVEDSLRRVEPGGELEAWITIVGAYPAALTGDFEAVRAGELACERASTDTSSVHLRALVSARLLMAGATRDLDLLDDAVRQARGIEAGRPMDPEIRAAWRVHAAEAAVMAGDAERAARMVDDLTSTLDAMPGDLPIHRLRRDHVAHELSRMGDGASAVDMSVDLTRRAATIGLELPPLLHDRHGAGRTVAAAQHALRFQLLGPFRVDRDDEALPDRVWGGRRQARLLLALLLAHGGRLDMDAAVEMLWGDIDPQTARARVAPLCNTLRSVIAEAGSATPPREVVVRGGSIALQLHERDRSDLEDLRTLMTRVRREPARARDLALTAFTSILERPIADLGTDHAAEAIRGLISQEVHEAIPVLAAAWNGVPAPRIVVDALRRLLTIEPTDSVVCARLMCVLRDAGDLPGASTAFHVTRTALRDEFGLAPPAELTRLHDAVLAADRLVDDALTS